MPTSFAEDKEVELTKSIGLKTNDQKQEKPKEVELDESLGLKTDEQKQE